MAKKSSYKILNTNGWGKAKDFVTQSIIIEKINNKAIIRNGETHRAYGMRSSSYELVRHEMALESFRKALLSLFPDFEVASAQLDGEGARMHLHVDLKRGYDFCPRFMLTNSYDGTLSLGMDVGLSHKGIVMMFENTERWIHLGDTPDDNREEKFKKAIKKGLKACLEKWVPRIRELRDIDIYNPRLSVEWFQSQRIFPEAVGKMILAKSPAYNGFAFFYAVCQAITNYECSPTRKRDMYFDVTKAFFSSQERAKWIKAVDKRRL